MKKKILSAIISFAFFTPAFASPTLLNPQQVTALFQQQIKLTGAQQKHLVNTRLRWERVGEKESAKNHFTIVPMKGQANILFAYEKREESVMYKSIDGGKHWTLLSLPHDWRLYDVISLDENRLLLAADNDIYISNDQGDHWSLWAHSEDMLFNQLFSPDSNTIFSYQVPIDVQNSYLKDGYYRTQNNGKTWIPSSLGLPAFNYGDAIIQGNQTTLLTTISNSNGDGNALYYSIDNGNTWKQPAIWKNHPVQTFSIDSKNNIYTISHQQLFKTDANKTNIAKLDLNGKCIKISIDIQDAVYILLENENKNTVTRSLDGGQTWQIIYEIDKNTTITDLKIEDNGIVLLVTDKDILQSDKKQLRFEHAAVPLTASVHGMNKIMALDETHYFTTETQGLGQVYGSNDAGKTWNIIHAPKDEILDFTILNNQLLVFGYHYGDKEIILYSSDDFGNTWQEIKRFANGHHAYLLSGQNGGLLVDLGDEVYFTHDLVNWNKLSFIGPYEHVVNYFDGKILYLSNGDWVKSSADDGRSWVTLLNDLNGTADAMTGYRKDNQSGILIAMRNAGILKTTDNGLTWDLFNQDFDFFFFNDLLAIDATHYFLATDVGVYYSKDGGQSWSLENQGLLSIKSISLTNATQRILVSTEGGIFTTSL